MKLSPVVDEGEDALGRKNFSRIGEALVGQRITLEGLVEKSFVQGSIDQGSSSRAPQVDSIRRLEVELVLSGKLKSSLR